MSVQNQQYIEIPVFLYVCDFMCTYIDQPYIFSVRADVVCRLRVICTFGQPFPDRCTVCGCVVHLTAFETEENNRKAKPDSSVSTVC